MTPETRLKVIAYVGAAIGVLGAALAAYVAWTVQP